MNRNDTVVAVIVTYHPEIKKMQRLLQALGEQVHAIVVVDNGSGSYVRDFIDSRHRSNEFLICFGKNYGIAAAHKAGIDWARQNGKTYVILFDQDSIPAIDMISHLLSALRKLKSESVKVAAVGPRYQDARNIDRPSFIRVNGLKVNKINCHPSREIVESDMIISSGCLIPLSSLEKVGCPLEELFIDQVDIEWCLRAKSLGYSLFGVCNAVMHHSLGGMPKFFLGRKFVHQNPLRHYYIFRNAVWLLSKNYVPLGWKILFIRSIFLRLFVYVCFVAPRKSYFRMMTKGIWHGLRGRLGKLKTGGAN